MKRVATSSLLSAFLVFNGLLMFWGDSIAGQIRHAGNTVGKWSSVSAKRNWIESLEGLKGGSETKIH